MGRFSCFYGYVPNNKQKKASQPSFETMVKMLRIDSQNNGSEKNVNPITLHEFPTNMVIGTDHHTLTSRSWKSGELKCGYDAESNVDSLEFQLGNIRRSLSVGCEMNQNGRTYDDCIAGSNDGDDTAELLPKILSKSLGTSLVDQDQEVPQSLSPQLSGDVVNNDSLSLYIECPYSSGQNSPNHSRISKCYSMPNFGSTSPAATGHSACVMTSHERSFEDLSMLSNKEENNSAHEAVAAEVAELNRIDCFSNPEKFDEESAVLDSYDYGGSSKDWIVPMSNEIGMIKHNEGNFSCDHWDQYTNEEFKIKQIEEWVIRLQHCSPVEEINEFADSCDVVKRGSEYLDDLVKVDFKVDPGMEAAKRYISSLNATATTAQLANYGLVAIPLLSAFVSLKVINLSGNSIVKITAGALPRGLHMLNLSKNKISTIEGLRELTRLRVLDLSYNKLSRIGHGLASCSTLKELYLAGNKISEVEGLHRLLKLTVLDLRFNKIATSKCLGQLAANYISLQAISLEGNPAQKNVGDEQLKKHLQGLLPQLAYYNRQNIKSSTLKDSSDRSVRLGISDRGLRSDHKSSSRRGSGAPKRSSHSSVHGQKGQASESLKQSKGKHVLVPPSGAKSSHRHQHFDIGNKLQSLRSGLSLHKSRSEGTLAVL